MYYTQTALTTHLAISSPTFIAERELVEPLGSNTKLYWGKDEEERLGRGGRSPPAFRAFLERPAQPGEEKAVPRRRLLLSPRPSKAV